MLFCPKCDSILDINKVTNEEVINTKIDDEVIKKIVESQELTDEEKQSVNIDALINNTYYSELDKKTKSLVDKKINKMLSKKQQTDKAVYICKCGYTAPIAGRTLIMSKMGSSSNTSSLNTPQRIKNMLHDKTLPHSRNYICPNKECVSHTDPEKRDAVFFRFSDSLQIWYICISCKSYWIGL